MIFGRSSDMLSDAGLPANPFAPPAASAAGVQSIGASAIAEDRAWAERQAAKQMDYQRDMSNTAYQRVVSDLKKAGLNVGLAYSQGGASAPVGSMASTSSTAQTAAVTRENNLFKVLNSVINGAFGLANTGISVAANKPIARTSIKGFSD